LIAFLALCTGLLCGARIFMPPAMISLGCYAGWLPEGGGWLSLWSWSALPWLLILAAGLEGVFDKIYVAPRCVVLLLIAGRLFSGAIAGTTVGALADTPRIGLTAGLLGAILGFLLSRAARKQMAAVSGSAVPGSLVEDGIVLLGAFFIVAALS
jgi:uncharacterized membrane protein